MTLLLSLAVRFLGPVLGRLALYGGIALIIGGGLTWVYVTIEHRGYNRAIEHVRQQDKAAIDAGAAGIRSVRSCRASGGMWNSATGKCERGSVSAIPPS